MSNKVVTQTFSSDINRYIISGEINSDITKDFLNFHTNCVKNGTTEVLLYINSPGGNISDMMTIVNLIDSGEIIYHTVAMGQACSAACMITAFGTFRWATEETIFLFHDALFLTGGNVRQMEESISAQKPFLDKVIEKFSSKTNRSKEFWMESAYSKITHDFYFDSKEALEYGLIDFVGTPIVTRQSQFIVELPVEMDEFESLMKKRGVKSEDLSDHSTTKKKLPKKKTSKKKTPKTKK